MTPENTSEKKPTASVGDVEVTTTENGGGKTHDWPKVTIEAKTHDWPKIHVSVRTHGWPKDKPIPDAVDIVFDLTIEGD